MGRIQEPRERRRERPKGTGHPSRKKTNEIMEDPEAALGGQDDDNLSDSILGPMPLRSDREEESEEESVDSSEEESDEEDEEGDATPTTSEDQPTTTAVE